MARQKSEKREQAQRLWEDSGRTIKLKEIAARLGVSEEQVRKWKCQDKWEAQPAKKNKSNVTESKSNVTDISTRRREPGHAPPKNKGGAPIGNQNAAGHGAPLENANAVKHGLYQAIINTYSTDADKDLFAAAGKVAGLQNELKIARFKLARLMREQERRQNGALQGTMGSAFGPVSFRLKDDFFEDAINKGLVLIARIEKQLSRAKIEQGRLELEKRRMDVLERRYGDGGDDLPDDGFLEALEAKAASVWANEGEGGET